MVQQSNESVLTRVKKRIRRTVRWWAVSLLPAVLVLLPGCSTVSGDCFPPESIMRDPGPLPHISPEDDLGQVVARDSVAYKNLRGDFNALVGFVRTRCQ